MGIETTDNIDNVIIPQRFIPFDIGTKITERYLVEINSYIDKKGFNYLEISGLMRTISQEILLKIRLTYPSAKANGCVKIIRQTITQ